MSAASKLLERMRRTKSGYGQADFEKLYKGFGFEKKAGGDHDKYFHPEFSIMVTVARHNVLATGYAAEAVKKIDQLIEAQNKKRLEEQARKEAEEQKDAEQKS
jgi:hypothetical protein